MALNELQAYRLYTDIMDSGITPAIRREFYTLSPETMLLLSELIAPHEPALARELEEWSDVERIYRKCVTIQIRNAFRSVENE